jgi:predicted tellurium resistance membrane protein TerC
MPRRPFPIAALSLGVVLVLLVVLRPAKSQTVPENPTKVIVDLPEQRFERVRLSLRELAGKQEQGGTLWLSALPIRTEIGTSLIDVKQIRRITFQREPGGIGQDSVQLINKSTIRGHVTRETFLLQDAPDAWTTIAAENIREMTFVRDEKPSLVGILLGLLTLTAMEIVLGIDNVIFLAIIAGKLPKEQQPRARRFGLAAALGTRLLLLFSLSFLLSLTTPVFTLPSFGFLNDMEAREISWRDLILLAGGLFLIGKSVHEMHEKLEAAKTEQIGEPVAAPTRRVSFAKTILTIAVVDIVFSLDSVITAVGMVDTLWVMMVAMVLAMLVMLAFAGPIASFVERHPTVKVLALSFLILIGVMLVAEGFGQHIEKGYIYAAMAFSLVVEMINMKLRKPAGKAMARG